MKPSIESKVAVHQFAQTSPRCSTEQMIHENNPAFVRSFRHRPRCNSAMLLESTGPVPHKLPIWTPQTDSTWKRHHDQLRWAPPSELQPAPPSLKEEASSLFHSDIKTWLNASTAAPYVLNEKAALHPPQRRGLLSSRTEKRLRNRGQLIVLNLTVVAHYGNVRCSFV